MRQAASWPEIVTALCARGIIRAQTLAITLAIACITGLKLRIVLLLWHLADRFGTVTPAGVRLRLPLTHQLIGRLVGASRPSVSTALKELQDEGVVSRRPDGGLVLHGEPPALAMPLGDRRRAARAAAGRADPN